MTPGDLFNQPFTQVTLPILLGFWIASLFQNKRFDDMGKRFEDMGKRFDDVGKRLDELGKRIDDLRADFSPRFDGI